MGSRFHLPACVLIGLWLPAVSMTEEGKPLDLTQHFTLPPGFVIERIAGPPVVKHPLHISFDVHGRAYVTDMAGVNRNGQQLEKELPNAIKRLVDTDGDGVFDQATVFADKLTFPGGVLWHDGAVYATAFPYLWKFLDKNDDGVADERVPVVGKFGSIGNAADLHGPQLGPDGWLYFCDGRNGHDLAFADGSKAKGRASGLYRCKPDGSGFERIFAGGMDNPVEVAFTPADEPLVCANIVISQPRHDAILYGIEGGVYPYDLKAVKELKWTGQYLPMAGDLGWVAVSSLIRYDHTAWGSTWKDNYFTAEFNTHKIRQHTITRDGAGFKTTSAEFLSCSHPDFHPTQIIQARDGSMILVDTGGWFLNGCPTSKIAKPNVHGGVYRVRKVEQPKVGEFGAKLERNIKQLPPEMNEREAMRSQDVDVVIRTLRRIGLDRNGEMFEPVAALLEHEHPAVRREAATVLGRLKNANAVVGLYSALDRAEDPFLEHALIFALISIHEPTATARGLSHPSPRVQRGVLLALDQMGDDALSWDQVAPLLQIEEARLKLAALEVMARRPAWTIELADYLERELTKKPIDPVRFQGLKNLLLPLANEPRVQQLVADRLACPEEPEVVRHLLLEAMAQADLKSWPNVWDGPLRGLLATQPIEDELLHQGILAAAASRRRNFDEVLRGIAETSGRPLPLRLAAAGVAVQDGKPVSMPLFKTLTQACRPEHEPTQRLAAARALGLASLSEDQLNQLSDVAARAGPLELPLLLGAWERGASEAVLRKLVLSLEDAPGLNAVTPDRLKMVFAKAPAELQSSVQLLLKKGRHDHAAIQARLDQLKPALTGGDIARGKGLFFGPKAVCSTCHRVGEQGGLVGPTLSQIGAVRTRQDLLEAIVAPNNSLARGYETFVVVTKDGKTLTGVLSRETVDAMVLTDAQRQEHKVLRRDVEAMTTSAVSTMPNGLDQQLTTEDIRDILAYLMTLKK
jgi:putative membrane-bound dehydrogenase-like protein